jgi:uncharacterized protein
VRRIVIDTNVFVAAGFNPRSAAARLLAAVREGRLQMIWNEPTRREAEMILRQIPHLDWESVADLFKPETEFLGPVDPESFVFVPDPDDRKFAALSVAAQAHLVTNDNHLLSHNNSIGIDVLTPRAFLAGEGDATLTGSPGQGYVREQPNRIDNQGSDRHAGVAVILREFVGPSRTFRFNNNANDHIGMLDWHNIYHDNGTDNIDRGSSIFVRVDAHKRRSLGPREARLAQRQFLAQVKPPTSRRDSSRSTRPCTSLIPSAGKQRTTAIQIDAYSARPPRATRRDRRRPR